MKARTQLWSCIPELIYEWYSDVMPDRFVGYMMRRRFEKAHFMFQVGEGGIIMHLELFDICYANLASVEANQPKHCRCAVFLA